MIGETRWRLADAIREKLIDMGYKWDEVSVAAYDLRPTKNNQYTDWFSWEGHIHLNGHRREIYSWDTMSDCLKGTGVTIDNDGWVQVYRTEYRED